MRHAHQRVGERLLRELPQARLGGPGRHHDPSARLGDLVAAHPIRAAVGIHHLVAEAAVPLGIADQEFLGRGEGGVVGAEEGQHLHVPGQGVERPQRVRGQGVDALPGHVEDQGPAVRDPEDGAERGREQQAGEHGDRDVVGPPTRQGAREPLPPGERDAGGHRRRAPARPFRGAVARRRAAASPPRWPAAPARRRGGCGRRGIASRVRPSVAPRRPSRRRTGRGRRGTGSRGRPGGRCVPAGTGRGARTPTPRRPGSVPLPLHQP